MAGLLVEDETEEYNPYAALAAEDPTPLQPADPADAYTSIIQDEQDYGNSLVGTTIQGSAEVNPDTYAHTRKMAKDLNVPLDILQGNQAPDKEIRSAHIVKSAQDLLSQYPRLQKFMLDPDNQQLTHDDLPALGALAGLVEALQSTEKDVGFAENVVGGLKEIGQHGKEMAVGLGTALWDSIAMTDATRYQAKFGVGLTPDELQVRDKIMQIPDRDTREQALASFAEKRVREETPVSGWLGEAADNAHAELQALQSMSPQDGAAWWARTSAVAGVEMLPMIAAGLAGRPDIGLSILGSQVFGSKFLEMKRKGFDSNTSASIGALFGAVEYVSEKVPLGILTKEGLGGLSRILQGTVAEGAQEMIVQAFEIAFNAGILDEGVSLKDGFDQIWQAGLIGATVGGGIAVGVAGIDKFTGRGDAQASLDYLQKLQDAKTGMDKTKLAGRSPEQMREALGAMTETDQDTVFIPADKLLDLEQSGALTGDELADVELTESRTETEKRSGDVEIKIADLLMLPEAQFAALAPHVRRNIKEFTGAEAQVAIDNREQDITDLLQSMEEEAAADPKIRPIFDTMVQNLTVNEGMDPSEAEEVANMYERQYNAMSELYDGTKTAEELFLRANIEIRRPGGTTAPKEVRPAASLNLQQDDVLRGQTVQLPDADGNLQDVNVGEEIDAITTERSMTEQLMECVNGS